MALSLRQLFTPVPVDKVLAGCLSLLDGFGFQATAWQEGEPARTFVEMVASLFSDMTYAVADIAAGNHAGTAKGAYADQIGKYQFKLNRVPAQSATGLMVLTASLASPPQTFAANTLLIADSSADDARTFNVVTGGTLNPGAAMTVTVTAAVPGTDSNIAPNQPALELRTSLVGVTVTNPPQPPATPANTWITAPGIDAETDGPDGRYNARMLGRWDRLSPNNTEGAYRAWVLEGVPAITRLAIRQGVTQGSIHITGATSSGGLSGTQTGFYPAPQTGTGQVGAVLDYLCGVTDGKGRRPINDALEVVSANQLTLPVLNVAIVVSSPFSTDAVARVTAALGALLGSPTAAPIGGKVLPASSGGVFLLSDLYSTVRAQQGVIDTTFPGLTGNVALGPDDIWTPAINVTMTITP
jgi:hypothetical protein